MPLTGNTSSFLKTSENAMLLFFTTKLKYFTKWFIATKTEFELSVNSVKCLKHVLCWPWVNKCNSKSKLYKIEYSSSSTNHLYLLPLRKILAIRIQGNYLQLILTQKAPYGLVQIYPKLGQAWTRCSKHFLLCTLT